MIHFVRKIRNVYHLYQNSKNLDYSSFYKNVIFQNVDDETMKEFVNMYNFDDIDRNLWDSIKKRLSFPIIQTNQDEGNRYKQPKGIIFQLQNEDQFAGIINYLRSKSNGNVDNVITLTSSSLFSDSYPHQNLIIYELTYPNFCSHDQPDSWVCFDFKNRKVIPTVYQIQIISSYQPKSWVIEGKNDNGDWINVDNKKDCTDLQNKPDYSIHIFKVENKNFEGFKYIRMKLTDKNWGNNNYFYIRAFELYGKLI